MFGQWAEQRAAYMAEMRGIRQASNAVFAELSGAIRSSVLTGRYADVTFQHDLQWIPEIEEALGDKGFAEMVFTEGERQYCGRSAERFTSAFAVKEAVMKTLDAWPKELTEIEVSHRLSGAPFVILTGKALDLKESLGIEHLQVAVTHSGNFAMAGCLGFWRKRYYDS